MFVLEFEYKGSNDKFYGVVYVTKGYAILENGKYAEIWIPEYDLRFGIEKDKIEEFLEYVETGAKKIKIKVDKTEKWKTEIRGEY